MRSSDCACREAADPSLKILPFLRAHSFFCVLKMKLMKYRVQSGLDCTDGRGDDKTILPPLPFRAEGTQSKPTIIFRG